MSSVQVLVYRFDRDLLEPVAHDSWEAFRRGVAPLASDAAAAGKVCLLLLTLRDGACELIEPVSLDVDEHGYLRRLHVSFAPLPDARVLDARSVFLARYLNHAHQCEPSPEIVERALAHARVAPIGANGGIGFD